MKKFRQFIKEARSSSNMYKNWMNQDQASDPQDRNKLQAKVIKHFSNPQNMKTALSDTNSLHSAWLLHQHMDTNPDAQQHFLNSMKSADPDETNPSIQTRAKFLQDRINVNNEIKRLHSQNPSGYKDAHGNTITGDPVAAVRDTSKFPMSDPPQNREDALKRAKQNNPLLHKAVINSKATTQPSYATNWPDVKND